MSRIESRLLLELCPDEKPEAFEHLEFAIAEFREMKMQPSLGQRSSTKDYCTHDQRAYPAPD